MDELKEIITSEACDILNVDKRTLWNWAEKGLISFRRLDPTQTRVFHLGSILAFKKKLPKERGRAIKILHKIKGWRD